MGYAQFYQGNHSWLEQLLCWKEKKKAWNATPLCLFWTLWKERNRRIFEDTELADQAILRSFWYMFSD